jgi:hypothetical protein
VPDRPCFAGFAQKLQPSCRRCRGIIRVLAKREKHHRSDYIFSEPASKGKRFAGHLSVAGIKKRGRSPLFIMHRHLGKP